MRSTGSLFLSTLIIAAAFGSVCAQRRGDRPPPPRDPQFYASRNQLEDFEARMETVLIKGRTYVGTVRAQNGTARVEATEIRELRPKRTNRSPNSPTMKSAIALKPTLRS